MGKSPDKTTIISNQNKTLTIIPKPLADQLELKAGTKVKWTIKGKNKLELEVLK